MNHNVESSSLTKFALMMAYNIILPVIYCSYFYVAKTHNLATNDESSSSFVVAEKRHNGASWRSWLSKQKSLQPPLKHVL